MTTGARAGTPSAWRAVAVAVVVLIGSVCLLGSLSAASTSAPEHLAMRMAAGAAPVAVATDDHPSTTGTCAGECRHVTATTCAAAAAVAVPLLALLLAARRHTFLGLQRRDFRHDERIEFGEIGGQVGGEGEVHLIVLHRKCGIVRLIDRDLFA